MGEENERERRQFSYDIALFLLFSFPNGKLFFLGVQPSSTTRPRTVGDWPPADDSKELKHIISIQQAIKLRLKKLFWDQHFIFYPVTLWVNFMPCCTTETVLEYCQFRGISPAVSLSELSSGHKSLQKENAALKLLSRKTPRTT